MTEEQEPEPREESEDYCTETQLREKVKACEGEARTAEQDKRGAREGRRRKRRLLLLSLLLLLFQLSARVSKKTALEKRGSKPTSGGTRAARGEGTPEGTSGRKGEGKNKPLTKGFESGRGRTPPSEIYH